MAEITGKLIIELTPEVRRHIEKARQGEIETLRAALEWYLEDDKKSVEMGILENVESRPAYAALMKTKWTIPG